MYLLSKAVFAARVAITIVLELLPERELEALVLSGDIGMGVEVVTEAEFVVIAGDTHVDVEDTLGEPSGV